jgi:ParB family transcriptional regulator, chromosome partitioning protein
MENNQNSVPAVTGSGKTDIWKVDPRNIHIEPGFNTRKDFDIDELKESIRKNGVQVPIKCYRDKSGGENFWVVDGERRHRAVMSLLEEGILVLMWVVVIKPPTPEQKTLMLVTNNDGKNLTPLEQGEVFKRLIDYAWTVIKISEQTGKSPQRIYMALDAANLPEKAKLLIIKHKLSAHKVVAESKKLKNPEDIVAVIEKSIEKFQNEQEEKEDQKKQEDKLIGKTKKEKKPSAKLDKIPGNAGNDNCSLKNGNPKRLKIEVAAENAEQELLKEGIKVLKKCKPTSCQNCIFPSVSNTVDSATGDIVSTKIVCTPISNGIIHYISDELNVTSEYQDGKLPKDCPLHGYKFAIELITA